MKLYLLAFAIGATTALGFAPASFPPVLLAGYAWLFWCLTRMDSPVKAFRLSYVFGFGQFVAGLYWIGHSTLIDAATWGWFWPFAAIGLPLVLALYPALAGYCSVRLRVPAMVLFAASELLRATLFTGFPWNLPGSTWINWSWIAQNADWAGLYGLSCITLLLAGLLAQWKNPRAMALAALLLVVLTGYGATIRQPTAFDSSTAIHIAQSAIPQKMKWTGNEVFANSLAPLAQSDTPPQNKARERWIIWPETAQASPIWHMPQFQKFYRKALADWPKNTHVLTGYLGLDENDYGNAFIDADTKGRIVWRQNKHHLVPFGEYMPFDDVLHLGPIVGIEGFDTGPAPRTMASGIIPLICYEIVFPDLARHAWTKNSRAIVTITDDSWFGVTSGPYQHFVQARYRAIETGLPVLRAANTGVSGIIDSWGRTLQATEMNTPATIDSNLPAHRDGATFFVLHGNLFVYLYFGIILAVLLWEKRFFSGN